VAKHRPYTPAHRGARLAHDLGSIPSVPTKIWKIGRAVYGSSLEN
jgi:hypothetical protein